MRARPRTSTISASGCSTAGGNCSPHIEAPPGGVWVDMGGGTGWNLEQLGPRIDALGKAYIVDFSPSMLKVARRRIQQRGWKNVEAIEADAIHFRPPEGQADVVTFSYSLTMIPDWFAAIENAWSILKSGGVIGALDFYVSRKHPTEGSARHGFLGRNFWPMFFSLNDVFPSLRASAVLAPSFPASPLQRVAGTRALFAAAASAVLHVHREESGGIAGMRVGGQRRDGYPPVSAAVAAMVLSVL